LPSATDDHQTANAREMARAGGARMIAQRSFTPVELAKQMQKLGLDPDALANAAARARAVGRPHAGSDLADLVERTGRDLGSDPMPAEELVLTPIPGGAYA
jgi:UDP-N-acetylglucosamine--N-acetylmuramyl-(pentapeptide) pyrophosphoryl-undecaprenol N-acetylglucosamine transferase